MTDPEQRAARRFEAVRHDASAGINRTLGRIAIDAMGMMTILSPGDDPDGLLPIIVEEQNRRPTMNVPVPPPPDAPRFATATRIVERGSAEFVPALAAYLSRYYAIELHEL
jgi:hypothetical protein